jgi:MFS family permease
MAQPFVEPCSRGVIDAEPCPRELGRESPPRRRRMVLAACVLASSMAFIDGSALTVALPRLRADFGADLASIPWVLNGYVLALASLTLIGGALADVYGKARMLGLGCALFGLASAACALAPSPDWLITARVVQGMAAAIVTPASLVLIGATYPRAERNRAIGVWAAASALTTAGGPVLGGWLTETFGWPSVFWINPPLALVSVGILLAFAPEDRREQRQFDVIGAAMLTAALGALACGTRLCPDGTRSERILDARRDCTHDAAWLSFAVLVVPLTASVMSSVDQTDEGLASGINNAASRIAQLAGVALAAGVASFASGYEVGLAVAAAISIGGAFTASMTLTPAAAKASGSGRA